jgi:hypothetical protein
MTSTHGLLTRRVQKLITALVSIVWYFLAAVLVVVLCLTAAFPFVGLPGDGNGRLGIPVSFTVDETHAVTSAALGIDDARLSDISGTLVFPPPRDVSLVALGLFLAVAVGVALWTMTELRRILRTVRDGQAFAPENVGRIRRIGWIVILVEPVRTIVVYAAHSFAMKNFSAPGLHFGARVDFSPWVILYGLIILALAEVFRAGTKLDEDQSLTI